MKEILPIRKRIRISKYDYSKKNIFFITICIKNRLEILGNIKTENYIDLTLIGKVVRENIDKISTLYKNVVVNEYCIMPNHIHIILKINYKNGTTISKIIKHFKTNVSRELSYSIWQKSFYEHIIKNENEYWKIKEYVKNNIQNWKKDKYF